MPDDALLMTRATSGDTGALRVLLERHGRQVWLTIHRMIEGPWRSLIDADDVMQVTYVEAFRHIGRLRAEGGSGFVSWLTQLAKNNLLDALRELGAQKRPSPARRVHACPSADSYTTLILYAGSSGATPSRQVAAREAEVAIEAALAQMPEDYARVLRLYDLRGCTVDEVAEQMKRSRGAVHMLRARAHDMLRALLGDAGAFFSSAE